jgi:hypothetical protein
MMIRIATLVRRRWSDGTNPSIALLEARQLSIPAYVTDGN